MFMHMQLQRTWESGMLYSLLVAQDAVAVLYALLQRYGEVMCGSAAGRHAIAATADAMLALLQVRASPVKRASHVSGPRLNLP